ncbi:MAG: TRAP transporter small permease subunit, partial [Anaerolineales bacterium]|nr:TRAP transporter small permease subunit [Anaerolineales bacterium]
YVGQFTGVKLTNNAIIELQWYLYTLIFFFGFAYILKNGVNVRVDFWFANQTPKRKAWIDFIGHILALLPFCILAIYVTYNPVLTSWGHRSNEGVFSGWDKWDGTSEQIAAYRANCNADPNCEINFQTLIRQMPWEISPDPDGLPRAPIKTMILVAFGSLFLQAIAEMIKLLAVLRGQEHLFKTAASDAPIRIE